MGRTPCCDKVGLKKGPWTPEEDQKLLVYIEQHGHGSWRALPAKAGLQRCGKSCRLRWTNYLRPDIKRGKFSLQEEQTIIQLHALLGNRWSAIATHLPQRTDNEIKNYWNTHLKKRLLKMGIDPVTHKPRNDALLSTNGGSKSAANLSHMAQWESARLEAEARLASQSKLRSGQIHPQLGSPAPDFSMQSAPNRCLDILNAWNSVWTKPAEADLESPTSTLSFSENAPAKLGESSTASFFELLGHSGSCEAGLTKEEEEQGWKGNSAHLVELKDNMDNSMSFTSGFHHDMTVSSMEGDWAPERFTDLLLNNSSDRSFSDGGGESDVGRGSASGYIEDNKNYWNSILNLVNSSPSNSPMF
ncbi:hypothetical protein NMG60_11006428 [Bertholletia excelsa]